MAGGALAQAPVPEDKTFILKTLLVCLTVTLPSVLLPYRYQTYLQSRLAALESREHYASEVAANIRYLDEVLTMSARLAAATGDAKWEARYRSFGPKLDAVIEEARRLDPVPADGAEARLAAVNAALVRMEVRSFALSREGRRSEALRLLTGRDYQHAKAAYAQEFKTIAAAGRAEGDGLRESLYRATAVAGQLKALGLLLVIAVWLMAGRKVHRRMRDREREGEDLRRARLDLEKQVSERTAELLEANIVLSQTILTLQAGERLQRVQAEVALILAEAPGSTDPLMRVLAAVCASLGWQEGAIWTVDEAAGVLRNCGYHQTGLHDEAFEMVTRVMTFSKGVGLPGRIWASKAPAWIVDVQEDSNFPRAPYAARAGLHAAFGIPIVASGRLLGVLEFFRKTVDEPDPRLLESMGVLGMHLGQFLEREQARKSHEVARAALGQAQKMEAVGKLAGGVAHDFNNILTIILGCCDGLSASIPLEDLRRQDLDDINEAAQRAARLTKQLLIFSRQQVLRAVPVDVFQAIANMQGMVKRLIPESIELRLDLHPALGRVLIDPGQFDQIIMNLVVNAVDAMPAGGTLRLEAKAVFLDEEACGGLFGLKPGRHLVLAVEDTGVGISLEDLPRIFEPFFTTKAIGKGTGLGLSMTDGIVRQSGGAIKVESALGKGSRFSVYLPTSRKAATVPPSAPEAAPRGRETILLVEDEEPVRRVARRILTEGGYTVLEAASAEEAMTVLEGAGQDVNLLLTDVVMPGGNGRELARAARLKRSGIKVLLMSGYTAGLLDEKDGEDEAMPLIGKPFMADALLRGVREALAAS